MDFYGHDAFSTRRPNLDAVTLGKGTADLSDIDTLNEWVDDAFGNKRLFITNFTLPTNDNWRYDFKVSASTQASWLTAALRIAKREKYIYSLAYNGLFDEESRGDDKQVESGLIALDGTKRPRSTPSSAVLELQRAGAEIARDAAQVQRQLRQRR